jgi:hypothetical protein
LESGGDIFEEIHISNPTLLFKKPAEKSFANGNWTNDAWLPPVMGQVMPMTTFQD